MNSIARCGKGKILSSRISFGSEISGATAFPHGKGVESNGPEKGGRTDAEEQGSASMKKKKKSLSELFFDYESGWFPEKLTALWRSWPRACSF